MRKLLFIGSICLSLVACHNANTQIKGGVDTENSAVVAADAPVIKFEEEIFEFKNIKEGDKVEHNFKFTNVGKSPLIISSAVATCGCTIPESPKEPILPGKEGVIKVIFNTNGKPGINDKVVTITSNANPTVTSVHLVGDVAPKK